MGVGNPVAVDIAPQWAIERVRSAFPMLARVVRGSRVAYLDSGATALKPQEVLDAVSAYYGRVSANVARGVHTLSQEATDRYEEVRAAAAAFLGADADEIVFTAGTTASLNLVAQTIGRQRLAAGDEILVSELEHHSNLVPWQLVAESTRATIRAIPVDDRGDLDLDWLTRHRSERTRVVAVCHVSNVLGTVNPVRRVADLAHEVGAICVIDGAQGAPHLQVDVAALGCDFYTVSVHKLFGPTGLGLLYGRRSLLEAMPPRHDRAGHDRAIDLCSPSGQVRGWNAANRRGVRARCGAGVHRAVGLEGPRPLRGSAGRTGTGGIGGYSGSHGVRLSGGLCRGGDVRGRRGASPRRGNRARCRRRLCPGGPSLCPTADGPPGGDSDRSRVVRAVFDG